MFFSVFAVALLAEGVDRNGNDTETGAGAAVALLAEGVDRNMIDRKNIIINPDVALLAEGVDRNYQLGLR